MRTKLIVTAGLLIAIGAWWPVSAIAQEPQPAAAGPAQPQRGGEGRIPLHIQVVISRYVGEKRVSSMPYVLAVNANPFAPPYRFGDPAQLRMGARVPVPALQPTPQNADGNTITVPVSPVAYEDIGTNLDCSARAIGDGLFEVSLQLDDKSLYTAEGTPGTSAAGPNPAFRTFRTSNTLLLRDGQSRQFTAATDRVNGETTRVEVTLSVAK